MTGFELMAVHRDWNRATERDWAEVLARLPLFSRLGKRRLRKIARHAQFAEFAPGDAVVLRGAPADSFYVVLGGGAKALKPGARNLGTGDYFGEMALLDGGPRSATVVATDELHVMRIPRQSFLQLVEQNAAVALTILTEFGTRVRRLERQPQPSLS
jgi:CRP-like cAMP-binding protein